MKDIENKIIEVLERLKPYLRNDGGDITFIKFEDGIVYVKFLGACSHCAMLDITLRDGIEAALIEEVPEVVKVVNVKD
jgi:Fe-S cluster biogenesis protein NfuA